MTAVTLPRSPGRSRLRALRELPARTPLRVTLVGLLLLLVTLALTTTGLAATTQLRSYLTERVDAQLIAGLRPVTAADGGLLPGRRGRSGGPGLGSGSNGPTSPTGSTILGSALTGPVAVALVDTPVAAPPAGPDDDRGDSSDVRYAYQTLLLDAEGTVLDAVGPPLTAGQAGPDLPALDVSSVVARGSRPFTVSAAGAGPDWRVAAAALPNRSGSLVVAQSLGDVDATVRRLARIDLVVSLVVLALLALVGYAVVRRSLRPLHEVEVTAGAIAAGDLTVRVPERDPRTEVGRLAAAFNSMLSQIEAAFAAQTASETEARVSEGRMRRFVADASHELRTPLTTIRGFAELFRQGATTDPADLARSLKRIEDEAARMGLLVDDLLLLARLDQQRPLERQPVDLLLLASDAVHDARVTAPDREIALELIGGPAPPVVSGDESRLRQVLGNLVGNALAHTPAGTPVTVRVGTVDPRTAELSVADSGPGLTPDEADRAFERFYRADPARTRARGGTGLGLSIVAALVAAHGGTVDVESRPGEGATFRVLLPL